MSHTFVGTAFSRPHTAVAAAITLALIANAVLSAQSVRRVLRDPDGTVSCIVSVPDSRSATPDADGMVVDIRVPATPNAALLSRLPAHARDYAQIPIKVFLIPVPGKADPGRVKLPPTLPATADLTPRLMTIGAQTQELYVRVQYPRRALAEGFDLVAQRTATADDGERLTTQTRCRIGGADALVWR